ncbi:MAG: fumarylacetoacetate hydrolase family protein [Rickettsiales bacterium]|nr:fumarylacetoacetate hydrolase family protein [Rickettsiales bacterium]
MRLAVLRIEDFLAPVIFHGAQAYGLWELAPHAPETWAELIEWLHEPAHQAEITEALSHATPVPQPYHYVAPIAPSSRIICVGLNYRDHAAEGKQAVPETPVFFIRYPSSFVGHQEALVAPRASAKYDYEAEIAVVIGKAGRHISHADALSHVFGYSIAMDGSVRDFQKRTPQWTLGKNFDESGALGPDIVTADAVPAGAHGLQVQTRLNGDIMQDGNSAEMIFPVADLIVSLSEVMRLEPGDVILTGTPAGVGFARTPPVYLASGDHLEVTVPGIGTLVNKITAE